MSENSQQATEQVVFNDAASITISVNYETRQITITKSTVNAPANVEAALEANEHGSANPVPTIEQPSNPSEQVLPRPSANVAAAPDARQPDQDTPESNVEERANPTEEAVSGPAANVDVEAETGKQSDANLSSNNDKKLSPCKTEATRTQKSVIFVQNEGNGPVNINIGTSGTNILRARIQEPRHDQSREHETTRKADSSSGTYLSNGDENRAPSEDSSSSTGGPPEDPSPGGNNGPSSSSEDENPTNGESEDSRSREDTRHYNSSQEDERRGNDSRQGDDNSSEGRDYIHCNGHVNQRIIVVDEGDRFDVEL